MQVASFLFLKHICFSRHFLLCGSCQSNVFSLCTRRSSHVLDALPGGAGSMLESTYRPPHLFWRSEHRLFGSTKRVPPSCWTCPLDFSLACKVIHPLALTSPPNGPAPSVMANHVSLFRRVTPNHPWALRECHASHQSVLYHPWFAATYTRSLPPFRKRGPLSVG